MRGRSIVTMTMLAGLALGAAACYEDTGSAPPQAQKPQPVPRQGPLTDIATGNGAANGSALGKAKGAAKNIAQQAQQKSQEIADQADDPANPNPRPGRRPTVPDMPGGDPNDPG